MPRFIGTFKQTEKAVYIVVSMEKDGRINTLLERKIPLITVRSVAMSNLRDDWLVRYTFRALSTEPHIRC